MGVCPDRLQYRGALRLRGPSWAHSNLAQGRAARRAPDLAGSPVAPHYLYRLPRLADRPRARAFLGHFTEAPEF
eukprot:8528179-Pyramimonas_sp.AAC.1